MESIDLVFYEVMMEANYAWDSLTGRVPEPVPSESVEVALSWTAGDSGERAFYYEAKNGITTAFAKFSLCTGKSVSAEGCQQLVT